MTGVTIGPAKAVRPIVVGTGASPAASSVATNAPVSAGQPIIIAPPAPKGDKGDKGEKGDDGADGSDGILSIYTLPLAP